MKGTKQERERSTKEDPSPSYFLEEKEDPNKTKDEFHFRFTDSKISLVYQMNVNENHDNSKFKIQNNYQKTRE